MVLNGDMYIPVPWRCLNMVLSSIQSAHLGFADTPCRNPTSHTFFVLNEIEEIMRYCRVFILQYTAPRGDCFCDLELYE